ncbi:hypothetical protein LVD15_22630 [Fulvivirga maritima]|uniref:hypothetical protein n=1 Tax=Fulvivirga maritima TaxID=2904247 RepID=UPI001F31E70E|nr:hypothetical protein [Fulvivirga maritima]UII26070.1 hypothetical protein LVD15_22630 [Fulvivirga maritima]
MPFQEIFVDQKIGFSIEKTIESYSSYIRELGVSTTTLVIDPKTNPWMKHDPSFQGVDFVELHFAKADIFEAIKAIRFYQVKILLQADDAIHQLTK